MALEHAPHDTLIQIEGVFGRLIEEGLVADGTNVNLSAGTMGFAPVGGERATRDEVATQLLCVYSSGHSRGAVSFDTEGPFGGRRVQEEVVDSKGG